MARWLLVLTICGGLPAFSMTRDTAYVPATQPVRASADPPQVLMRLQKDLSGTFRRFAARSATHGSGKQIITHPIGPSAKAAVPGGPRSRLTTYKARVPHLHASFNERNGTPTFLKAPRLFTPPANAKTADPALSAVHAYTDLFRIQDAFSEFRVTSDHVDDQGRRHVKFQQVYRDLPMWGKELIVHLDANGTVYLFEGRIEPTPRIEVNRTLTAEQALAIVRNDLGTIDDGSTCEAVIYVDNFGTAWTAYAIAAVRGFHTWRYIVDARFGQVLLKYNDTRRVSVSGSGIGAFGTRHDFPVWQEAGAYYLVDTTQPMHAQDPSVPNNPGSGNILVLSANGADPETSRNLVMYFISSTSATGGWDATAVTLYDHLRTIQNYYQTTFGRNAIDTRALNTIGVIHCGGLGLLGNAGWFPGINMIFFGEDAPEMRCMARALDFTAHEFTHGVTSFSANMEYLGQSGALNEAFSDIFACMIDRDDWTMGEDIVTVSPGYGRNLVNPHDSLESQQTQQAGIGPEPAHMSEYRNLPAYQDNGGVHVNATIPGHAAYQIAEGLGAQSIGRAKTEQIFYKALTAHLTRQSNFSDCRRATIQSAEELYGANSPEVAAVAAGWDAVGVVSGDEGPGYVTVTPAQGNDGLLFVFRQNGQSYLGVRAGNGKDYYVSRHPVRETRPVVVQDGAGALFVDATNNLRLASLDPNDTYDVAITSDGIVRSIAGSHDGRYFAFTTTDLDNYLYILDTNDSSGNSNQAVALSLPSDSNISTATLKYADVIDFDLSGKKIIFDALNEIRVTSSTQTFRTWSIGILDLASGSIQSLVPGQQPGVQIGNPAASNTRDWLVAVDVWDNATNLCKTLIVNLTTGQTGLVAQETDPKAEFGWPTFSGDDASIALAYQNQIVRMPVTETAGVFAADFDQREILRANSWYPRYYRSAASVAAPIIQASTTVIAFGEVAVGQSATRSVLVANTGASDLQITGVQLSDPASFTTSGRSMALPSGMTAEITVTFTPRDAGARTGTLTITSDDPATPNLIVSLQGSGVAVAVAADSACCASAGLPAIVLILLVSIIGPCVPSR